MLLLALLSLLGSPDARATSRVAAPTTHALSAGGQTQAAYCEVDGQFRGERYDPDAPGTKVFWEIGVNAVRPLGGARCPEGASFSLAIRGAERLTNADGSTQFTYMEYVVKPEPFARVTARVRRHTVRNPKTGVRYREWLVINWVQGIERKSE
jgi:hypothetical protein